MGCLRARRHSVGAITYWDLTTSPHSLYVYLIESLSRVEYFMY